MFIVVFFLVGAGLLIAPWFFQPQLGQVVTISLSVTGFVTLVMLMVASVITRLYRKASANMAFVRTGMGGVKVIQDGGAIVVPVIHQTIPVSLETMRLNVERRGNHALITRDNLRVDLSAEFYIKVQANAEDVLQAARSLGGRNVQPEVVSELVQEKLVSALRTVAATKDLVELHCKRDEFASSVQQIVTHDLSSNGLTLESVTISSLDQTDPTQLQERNVFDAQGLRKIAEITQKARIERNIIEREAEKQVVTKNVSTSKAVLDLQREQAEFEAEQKAKIEIVKADRNRETMEFKIAQDEAVSRRDIEKMKAVESAEVDRQLTIEQAQMLKQKTLALKEKERADAQAALLLAEAEREKAAQQVVTVTVAAEAEREAQKKLIAAQQQINEKRLREQTDADVLAYTKLKDAEAQKGAALLQYEAKIKLAEGDAESAARRSEGDQALKMVDINVERERVNVEQARVEVERLSLANRSEFDEAAIKFELEKLRIDADKQVRIAAAEALGNMLAKAQMQIFGDPETMTRMSAQFMRAASMGTMVDGLLKTLPEEGKAVLGNVVASVADSLTPKPPSANGKEALADRVN